MKMKTRVAAAVIAAAFAFSAVADDVWYEGLDGVTVSGTGAASVAYRSESETNAWLHITVEDGVEATLTSITPDPAVTLSIQKLGDGSLDLTSACGGFTDLKVTAGSALLASTADVPGTTYLAGGELVAVTNFTAGKIVLTADSSIRVAPDMTMQAGARGNVLAAGHTLSKFGEGTLDFNAIEALSGDQSGSTYIVEEGTLQLAGDCWGGHSSNGSGFTLVVHENGTVLSTSHVPLPNVVMRGGRFDGYTASVFDGEQGEQKLRFYKSWAFKHTIKVLPSTNGAPSIVSSYACHIGHTDYMPTFDIDEGAELQLDVMLCNGAVGGTVFKDSGFTKIGTGTLTFLRGGALTGTTTLKEGTLKFAAGASLGPDATLNTYAGTTIELEDGAAFDTPVNSSMACTAAEYEALTNSAIWVDAWQETAEEGASVQTIANLGTVAGSFAPPTTGSYKNPCTFTANGVNGRPSYKFNGNQTMLFSNLTYGTLDNPQHDVMIFIAFERSTYRLYYGLFAFALASNTGNDNGSKGTLFQEDDGERYFGFYNRKANGSRQDNVLNPCNATNGAPCVFSVYGNSSSRRTWMDYLDGTNHSNSNPGAFELAFDRMSLGGRMHSSGQTAYPWTGAIGEVIVCTNYNETTYNTLQAYMKRKWLSGRKGEKCGVVAIKVPQGTAAAVSLDGLNDGRTPTLTKTGAGELMVGSVAADGDVVVSGGALSLIPTSVVSKIDVWMDAADEDTLTVTNGEVVSVRNKGRAGGIFVKNPRAGDSGTVSPNLPTLTSMNGHTALGFDGTRALVLDSYTNHNDDATFTVFLAARVGDGVELYVAGDGAETSPFSLATAASTLFDYDAPVGCHFEPKTDGRVLFYSDVKDRLFATSRISSLQAGTGIVFAHYNYNYGALAYLQTFTNGVAAEARTALAPNSVRPYPSAIDVVSVGGRLGPRGTSYYYGVASTGRLWRGEVGELIVCTRQPTEAERAAILAYLRAKWFLPGGAATTPAAIETVLAPALDRNVKVTAAAGSELKSFASTQPLSSLAVNGNITLTRGGEAAANGAMFDIAGDLLLPADMTLRMLSEPTENTRMDILTCSGTLNASGTAWSIDARRSRRWSVETTQNAVRVRYKIHSWVFIR